MSTDAKTGFKPLFERILIKPDSVEKKTETGIILPVEARKRPNTGTVIAVGHMVSKNSECPIQEGDYVLYQRYSGLNVKWAGEDFHVVMANDLVAVLNKDIDTTFEISDHA
jgi:chaperonin GroES